MGGWARKTEGEESRTDLANTWRTCGGERLPLVSLEVPGSCKALLCQAEEFLRSRKQKTYNIFQTWQKTMVPFTPAPEMVEDDLGKSSFGGLRWVRGRGWGRPSDRRLLPKLSVNQGCTKSLVPVYTISIHLCRASLERSKGLFVFLFGEPT